MGRIRTAWLTLRELLSGVSPIWFFTFCLAIVGAVGFALGYNHPGSAIHSEPAPVYRCQTLVVVPDPDTLGKFRFRAEPYAANGAEFAEVEYEFGNGRSATRTNIEWVVHTYAEKGEYIVLVTLTFNTNTGQRTASCSAVLPVP